MSEESTATPSSCGSAGERRPSHLRPAASSAQQARGQEHRREAGPSPQAGGSSQENRRRFQKRYKVATGPSKQRHARRFCRGFKQPRVPVLRRRQPRNETSQQHVYSRPQSMSEETFNRQLSQLTSLETLRHELDDRMAAVLQELAAARENPTNAMPRIAAAANAQVKVMKELIEVLRSMD